jgi:hypothetical protein
MNLSKRRLWLFGAIAIGAIILLTLLAAPTNNRLNSGSTYNRAPEGYGAWYAFMAERGTPVQRWRKPFEDLANNKEAEPPITLLRVNSALTKKTLSNMEQDWVKSGNTLVILGVHQPVTEAAFSTTHNSSTGSVKIDTQRRAKDEKESLLGDRFGAIVWQKSLGEGQVIFATTPYLAANAYQDFQGNYEFLAQLVTQSGVPGQQQAVDNRLTANRPSDNSQNPMWVDEYIHGYRDLEVIKREHADNRSTANRPTNSSQSGVPGQQRTADNRSTANRPTNNSQNPVWVDEYIHGHKDSEVIKGEQGENIFSYLAKTPLFPAFMQGFILLLVAIWALNRRFGKPLTLSAPVVDNSEAYIQALGGVLQKANSTEFILEVVGKEEQLQLQKALFLGDVPLDHQSLVNAWVQQTGRPATELEQVLQMQSRKRRMSETELLTWLGNWEQIRRHLSS